MQLFKIKKLLTNKNYRFLVLCSRGFYNYMDDKKYLEKRYYHTMGYELDLNNPVTFNEKLQWLKLNDKNPQYTELVDKYKVRSYIKDTIGEQYLIPLIGVWDRPEDIEFDSLPNQFVLKCNHNSGLGMCICKDKSKLNIKKTKRNLKKGLRQDYYLTGREWPYKDVERKIICEEYISDKTDEQENLGLTDYKFFCFNGEVDSVMVCIDREIQDPKFYFFDIHWKLKRLNLRGKEAPKDFTLPKPYNFEKMINLAEILSKNLPFSRIDLYESDKKIYFGEITFFPDSGFDSNLLKETDYYFGNKIKLPMEGNS